MTVKIVTDSTAYIDRKLLKKWDISEVSMIINLGNSSVNEVDLNNDEFYKSLEGEEKLPTSSQPSPIIFYEVFRELVQEGHGIVSILLSSGLGGAYYSALQARNMILQEFPDAQIELIDSKTTVMHMGLAVLAAAKRAKAGESIADIVNNAKSVLDRTKFFFIPGTLEYLRKGGRIGDAMSLLGTLLKVKPILTVKERVTVYDKVRTFEKAVKKVHQIFKNDYEMYGIEEIAIHHINCPYEAQHVIDKLNDITDTEILVSPIGPVIGVHVGPGTLGIAYTLKKQD
ncbi:MAG: DegV family protein [Clostridia bacterium]|nr:DegV family protein [Clostridia bacterium]MDD4047388.1 DegV family protein [Clostridia bacterium]